MRSSPSFPLPDRICSSPLFSGGEAPTPPWPRISAVAARSGWPAGRTPRISPCGVRIRAVPGERTHSSAGWRPTEASSSSPPCWAGPGATRRSRSRRIPVAAPGQRAPRTPGISRSGRRGRKSWSWGMTRSCLISTLAAPASLPPPTWAEPATTRSMPWPWIRRGARWWRGSPTPRIFPAYPPARKSWPEARTALSASSSPRGGGSSMRRSSGACSPTAVATSPSTSTA